LSDVVIDCEGERRALDESSKDWRDNEKLASDLALEASALLLQSKEQCEIEKV